MSSPVVAVRPWRGFAAVTLAYLVALAVAAGVMRLLPDSWHPMWRVVAADVAATVAIFGFSFALDNTSVYDPYWSVAPMVIAAWLALGPGAQRSLDLRQLLVLSLVATYGLRLTWNWARGWSGLRDEDWRYVQFRARGRFTYWLVSFSALHLFPTVVVLLGVLPLHAALVTGSNPLNALDVIATLVTAAAVLIEGLADNQLRAFRADPANAQRICDAGLWSVSRHPNYFGEISFWVGLFLFGLAAGGPLWSGVGPLSMIALFVRASIPMAEKRALARRPAFAEHQRRVSMLVPWFQSKRGP